MLAQVRLRHVVVVSMKIPSDISLSCLSNLCLYVKQILQVVTDIRNIWHYLPSSEVDGKRPTQSNSLTRRVMPLMID